METGGSVVKLRTICAYAKSLHEARDHDVRDRSDEEFAKR